MPHLDRLCNHRKKAILSQGCRMQGVGHLLQDADGQVPLPGALLC